MRYVAFISYSHADKAHAEWLHRALERYRIPKRLAGRTTARGIVPQRLIPIFRDRDELGAASDLGTQLRAALADSRNQIVIASPAASQSQWVGEEIRTYKMLHGEGNVLSLIVGGEPYASAMPGREAEEAFPAALRLKVAPDGMLTDVPAEPLAADIRPGKDGRRLALLKLVAGITGLRLDDLVQREAHRRAQRMTAIAVAASIGMLLTSGLAFYANMQRERAVEQRAIAERETAAARAATDYLIGTFELTNPATENPRTVSLVTILGRSAERARTELRDQPAIEARLVTAVGRAYNNLGLFAEAQQALAQSLPAINRAGRDGAPAIVTLADTRLRQGKLEDAARTILRADNLLGPDLHTDPGARAQVAMMKGKIAHMRGQLLPALAQLDTAIAFLKADPTTSDTVRADALNGRGLILADLGRYDEAEADLLAANRLYRQTRGEAHFQTGRSWFALAQNAFYANRLELAEQRIDRANAILSRMLDRTNPIRATALSLEGQILAGEGRYAEADRVLGEAVSVYRATLGEPHFQIGITEVYRAINAGKMGHLAEALQHFDIAKRNYDASYGEIHPNHGDLLVNRALVLARFGRLKEAQQDCEAGIAILNKKLGKDDNFTKSLTKECIPLLMDKKGDMG